MVTLISHSVSETVALGEEWGRTARPGWLVGLTGGLGAGKTQLVKGVALGLGVRERVHSPTFALVNEYRDGRLPLFHLDLYRLETAQQLRSAGLDDYFPTLEGVTVVEWFERWQELGEGMGSQRPVARSADARRADAGGDHPQWRRVFLETLNPSERRISYEDLGA